jgi:hypothetical protein
MTRRDAEKALGEIEILLGENESEGAREVLDELARRIRSPLTVAPDGDAEVAVELTLRLA